VAWSISARRNARSAGWPPGPASAARSPPLILGVEQQHGGGIGEGQRITEREGGQRAWALPVQAQHPGADRPDLQREREDRRRPGLTCRQREDRPAAPGFSAGQIRGQHRAARGGCIQARALPQGQVRFGELLADLISHPHQVTRLRAGRGTQPRAGDLNRSHGRRAHIRGRHTAAAAGGLRRDQAPDPARPASCHPRSQRSESGGWIRARLPRGQPTGNPGHPGWALALLCGCGG
jgi:hypothetical protein